MLYQIFGPPYAALYCDNLQVSANPPAYRYEKRDFGATRNRRFYRLGLSRNENRNPTTRRELRRREVRQEAKGRQKRVGLLRRGSVGKNVPFTGQN